MAIKVSNGKDTYEVDESKLGEAQKDGFVPTVKVTNGKEEHEVHPEKLKLAEADGFKPIQQEDQRSTLDVIKDATNVLNFPKNLAAGLHKVDEYTGAPIRKFITEKVTGKEMDHAPSGVEQAERMGFSDQSYGEQLGIPESVRPYVFGNVKPKELMGAALEVVQDPMVLGSAIKSGAQAALKVIPEVGESLIGRATVKTAQTQAAAASAESAAKAGAHVSGGGSTVEQGGKLFSVEAPKSLDELKQWKPQAGTGELPGKGRLKEIESVVPDLQTKPLKYHYDMMENPKAMKELKLNFENLPTEDAKKIAAYNQEIVDESARKVRETVNSISPNEARSLTDAGDDLISAVKEKYKTEKSALGPVFEELKKSPRATNDEIRDLAQAIGENTKLGKIMAVDEEGKIFLQKNTPRTGISDAEHGVLSRVIDDMNHGMTFKEMQDTRSFLRKSIDPMNPGASSEINKVRSILLDQMELKAEKLGANVGETFKRYAINERARENVEKVIGGKIESFDAMYSANPDRVVKKIFANPNYAQVIGDYVGPEKMQDMIASYVKNGVEGAYDSAKGFDPTKLRNWLKTNAQFMNTYAGEELTQRLNALADYGFYGKRFLDEVNPSGAAASLLKGLKPEGFFQKVSTQGFTGAVMSETGGRVQTSLKQRQATQTVNEMLGGAKPTTPLSKKISINPKLKIDGESVKQFQTGAAAIRSGGQGMSSVSASNEKSKGYDKWANDGLKKLQAHDDVFSDPAMIEQLKKSRKGQDLLIEALYAEPKSKKMESLVKKIKSATLNGGE